MLKRILLVAALLAIPVLVVAMTLALRLGATLDDCGPMGDDEFHYWDEIASFAGVGLNGGYFVADEDPPNSPGRTSARTGRSSPSCTAARPASSVGRLPPGRFSTCWCSLRAR